MIDTGPSSVSEELWYGQDRKNPTARGPSWLETDEVMFDGPSSDDDLGQTDRYLRRPPTFRCYELREASPPTFDDAMQHDAPFAHNTLTKTIR